MAAGATYEPIATTTVSGSSATDVTFSSISSTYTDLIVTALIRSTRTGTGSTAVYLQVNNDTGTNYSQSYLYGDGAGAASGRSTNVTSISQFGEAAKAGEPAGKFSFVKGCLFSYAGSTKKTILSEWADDLNGAGYVGRTVGLWNSTSAINSIKITTNAGNIEIGSVITLYGIKAA